MPRNCPIPALSQSREQCTIATRSQILPAIGWRAGGAQTTMPVVLAALNWEEPVRGFVMVDRSPLATAFIGVALTLSLVNGTAGPAWSQDTSGKSAHATGLDAGPSSTPDPLAPPDVSAPPRAAPGAPVAPRPPPRPPPAGGARPRAPPPARGALPPRPRPRPPPRPRLSLPRSTRSWRWCANE